MKIIIETFELKGNKTLVQVQNKDTGEMTQQTFENVSEDNVKNNMEMFKRAAVQCRRMIKEDL